MEDDVCHLATFSFLLSVPKTSFDSYHTEMPYMSAQYSPNDGMYFFFIRNNGKFFFRIGGRESYFSDNTEQKAASFSS